MSVTCWAYLVDWSELEKRCGPRPGEDQIQEAISNDEAWLDRYSSRTWIDSGNAMCDFLGAFEQIEDRIPPTDAGYLREALSPFGILGSDDAQAEARNDGSITKSKQDSPFGASLSPQTLRRVLASFEAVSWHGVESACRGIALGEAHIQTIADLKTYVESWAGLVRTAVEDGRGVLLYAA